jgi:hypothetical protein
MFKPTKFRFMSALIHKTYNKWTSVKLDLPKLVNKKELIIASQDNTEFLCLRKYYESMIIRSSIIKSKDMPINKHNNIIWNSSITKTVNGALTRWSEVEINFAKLESKGHLVILSEDKREWLYLYKISSDMMIHFMIMKANDFMTIKFMEDNGLYKSYLEDFI